MCLTISCRHAHLALSSARSTLCHTCMIIRHCISHRTADSSGLSGCHTCISACLQTPSQACLPVFGYDSAQFIPWHRYPTAVQPHICMSWQAYPRIYDATLRASAMLQKLCKGGNTTLDMGNLSSRTTAGQCAHFCRSQAININWSAVTSALFILQADL